MRPWSDPEFLEDAHAWIRATADVTGPIEQTHVQFWSTVLRVPTSGGVLWFKAPEDGSEIDLTVLLGEVRPRSVPEVVATDRERGWMLLRDAGTRLRDVLASDPDPHHWETVLGACAELQLAVAPQVERLLGIGVPDGRLGGIPGRVADLLEDDAFLMLDQPEGLTSTDRETLRALVPTIHEMCEELASVGVPDSVQHDDLNDGNVYVDTGGYRIVDWGDACVSHPFHTLTVALRATAYQLDLEPGGPEIERLRDAYLEPFSAYGSRAELAVAADTAYRTGTLARALAWRSYLEPRAPEDRADDLEAVPYGLRKFLERGPLGDWR